MSGEREAVGGQRSAAATGPAGQDRRVPGAGRRGPGDVVVPDADFRSYYDHPVVKPAPWDWRIPAYLYTGGLAAGSALIAAGAQATGRSTLQRSSRLVSLGAVGASTVLLVADLGRPERFLAMMRTVKLTSPMSVGSWILAAFGGLTGAAATVETVRAVVPVAQDSRLLGLAGSGASLGSALFAPPLAAYTAVLLSNTATPTWHAVYRELPFVFVASGSAAAGGAAMVTTRTSEAGPARSLALGGAAVELAAFQVMHARAGIAGEPLHTGKAGRFITASKIATAAGMGLTLLARRSRTAAVLGGAALNVGSALLRLGVFEAGMASARDPRYTVVPQRQRLDARRAAQAATLAEGQAAGGEAQAAGGEGQAAGAPAVQDPGTGSTS